MQHAMKTEMKTLVTLLAIPVIGIGNYIGSKLPSFPTKCHDCNKYTRDKNGVWEPIYQKDHLKWLCHKCAAKRGL